jgi:hypothetical protein
MRFRGDKVLGVVFLILFGMFLSMDIVEHNTVQIVIDSIFLFGNALTILLDDK